MNLNNRHIICFFLCLLFLLPVNVAGQGVTADSIMGRLFSVVANGDEACEFFGDLYVKQRVEVIKNNLALNTFPDMTRFDKGVKDYVTELFYEVCCNRYGVLEMRRKSYNTSFKHGKGEIERFVDFLKVNPYEKRFLLGGVYSPLSPEFSKYYTYRIDSIDTLARTVRVVYEHKFENIRLLERGWLLLDDSCRVKEFFMQGWDEQSRFSALYKMKLYSGCNVVDRVSVDIDYNFLGNKLNIVGEGVYSYDRVSTAEYLPSDTDKYNLGSGADVPWDTARVRNHSAYAVAHRPLSLKEDERLLLGELDTLFDRRVSSSKSWAWEVGDQMISSLSYEWRGGGVKFSPLIDPSHVDYSTSRGLSYKLSMNVRSTFGGVRELRLKPQVGYNFKQKAFYWNVAGTYAYNVSRPARVGVDFGEGNRMYSSVALDRIKSVALDSLDFKNLNLNYFRNFYAEAFHESELVNGLQMLLGVNFHRRVLKGDANKQLGQHDILLQKKYVQFAPHLRLTWQPGTYYYMNGGRKINLGSSHPVVAWDVEQGMSGVLGSNSKYMRSELDVQYHCGVKGGNTLYLRFGAGGYFYTKDVYFVDYSFLKQNNLPVNRSEELGGVFQLLDSEWYNSASKYLRANATLEAPFLVLHRLFPQTKYLQNEYIYYNVLFISQLHPYMEAGYGVATPYVDAGLFVSSQNLKPHRIGCKISFSLFSD